MNGMAYHINTWCKSKRTGNTLASDGIGVSLGQGLYPNYNKKFYIPKDYKISTYRELIQYIAQMMGVFVCMDRSGNLIFRDYEDSFYSRSTTMLGTGNEPVDDPEGLEEPIPLYKRHVVIPDSIIRDMELEDYLVTITDIYSPVGNVSYWGSESTVGENSVHSDMEGNTVSNTIQLIKSPFIEHRHGSVKAFNFELVDGQTELDSETQAQADMAVQGLTQKIAKLQTDITSTKSLIASVQSSIDSLDTQIDKETDSKKRQKLRDKRSTLQAKVTKYNKRITKKSEQIYIYNEDIYTI